MQAGDPENTQNATENQGSQSTLPNEDDARKKVLKEQKKARKAEKKEARRSEKIARKEKNKIPDIPDKTASSGYKPFGSYLIDLLIVILGVSISFLLSEWKNAQSDKKKEIYLLEGLKEDLQADTTIIASQINLLNLIIDNADSIMNYQGEPVTTRHISQLLTQFNSSVFPISNITFDEMYASGNAGLIKNKALLKELNRLYKIQYTGVQEWLSLEKQSVMETIFPLVNERFPFAKNYTYSDSVHFQEFEIILKETRVLNAVQNNVLIKKGILRSYHELMTEIKNLLAMIEQELKNR